MNKKGFTLVELIVVIVIVALIALISVPAVINIIRDARERRESVDADVVLNAAYDFMLKDRSRLPASGSSVTITIIDIQNAGILREDITDCRDDAPNCFNRDDCIRVTNHQGQSAETNLKPSEQYFGTYFFEYFEHTSSVCP